MTNTILAALKKARQAGVPPGKVREALEAEIAAMNEEGKAPAPFVVETFRELMEAAIHLAYGKDVDAPARGDG